MTRIVIDVTPEVLAAVPMLLPKMLRIVGSEAAGPGVVRLVCESDVDFGDDCQATMRVTDVGLIRTIDLTRQFASA